MPFIGLAAAVLLSLYLAGFACARTTTTLQRTLPFLDDASQQGPTTLKVFPPGYEPAVTEQDWEPFIRDNLHDDLWVYKERIKKTGKKLSARLLAGQIQRLLDDRFLAHRSGLFVIRNNSIFCYTRPGADDLMVKRVTRNMAALADLSARLNLSLPDTVFLHNGYDEPACGRLEGGCMVPVFSMVKQYDWGAKRSIDADMLFPHMGHVFNRLIFYPWKDKDPRALLRSTMQNTMSLGATRVVLANLSASPEGSPLLDVGFVANRKRGYRMPPELMRGYVGIQAHSRYRFLINANGHTASSRRGHIMQCNSVTLEEQSPWIEYYWRSLVPGVHYLPYSVDTVVPLLRNYSDPSRDGELRAMANASQHFVARFLTLEGKVRYAVRALHAYTALFNGLSEFVADYTGLDPGLAPAVWADLLQRGVVSGKKTSTTSPYRSERFPGGSFDPGDLVAALRAFKPAHERLLG